MIISFYITNHGFGHASRNVPIVEELLRRNSKLIIHIKSDRARCNFLKRNLAHLEDRIEYFDDCTENGLILKEGLMLPDVECMRRTISADLRKWDAYIAREEAYMKLVEPTLVIADVVCWAIRAAHNCGIKTLLIGNFAWSQMYQSFFGEDIWGPYLENYRLADKAMWYEIHDKSLDTYCSDTVQLSLVSRHVNWDTVQKIKSEHAQPIVFVSNGASAELADVIDVGHLPYDFLITRGLKFSGDNVFELPLDMINTPDYIAAAEYVIAKGGWSTVAEILLQKKRCALIFRGNNSEDDNTRITLEARGHCVGIQGAELAEIEEILRRIELLQPTDYDMYYDDTTRICDIMMEMINGE